MAHTAEISAADRVSLQRKLHRFYSNPCPRIDGASKPVVLKRLSKQIALVKSLPKILPMTSEEERAAKREADGQMADPTLTLAEHYHNRVLLREYRARQEWHALCIREAQDYCEAQLEWLAFGVKSRVWRQEMNR